MILAMIGKPVFNFTNSLLLTRKGRYQVFGDLYPFFNAIVDTGETRLILLEAASYMRTYYCCLRSQVQGIVSRYLYFMKIDLQQLIFLSSLSGTPCFQFSHECRVEIISVVTSCVD